MIYRILATLVMLFTTIVAHAEVEIQSKGMTVFGQSELPKVLYIVPWKRKELPDIEAPQTASLINDVLTPIDPAIFERQVHYYELMTSQAQKTQ